MHGVALLCCELLLILRAESVVNAGGSREGEEQDISEDESSPRGFKEQGRGPAGRMQATPMHGLHPKDQAAARAAAEALSHITDRLFCFLASIPVYFIVLQT